MFGIIALACALQDSGLPLPPDTDRTVPLEAPKAEKPAAKEESRPLVAANPAGSRKLVDRPEAGPSLGGFLFWSSAVIALLIGAFLLFKRFARGSRLLRGAAAIDVLARRGLAPRQEMLLVEVAGRVLVLASTRERITTLSEIADADEIARLKARLAGPEASKMFGDTLKSGLRDFEKGEEPERKARSEGLFEELAALKKTVQAWRA